MAQEARAAAGEINNDGICSVATTHLQCVLLSGGSSWKVGEQVYTQPLRSSLIEKQ